MKIFLALIFPILTLSFVHLSFASLASGATTVEEAKQTKIEVQKDLEQGFEKLKIQVKELQESAKGTTGAVKKDLEQQIANLQKDQMELQVKLRKLKNSSGEAWKDLKSGTSEAYEKFKTSVLKAKERFQEKVEEQK
jgi:hypothetical protein